MEDIINKASGCDRCIGCGQGHWRELSAFSKQGVQDSAFMVLGGLDEELMNFRLDVFGGDIAKVEQPVTECVTMFVSESLHSMVTVELQAPLVVVTESGLKV